MTTRIGRRSKALLISMAFQMIIMAAGMIFFDQHALSLTEFLLAALAGAWLIEEKLEP